MNINEIHDGQPIQPNIAVGIANKVAAKRGPSSEAGISSDRVDTSIFSKLMQRGARELQDYLKPRADKITEFAETLEDPIIMSDQVIQSVVAHMAGA